METDLSALCLRVWGKVPAAKPKYLSFHIRAWYYVGLHQGDFMENDEAESMIQAACLRWLLTQEHIYIYPPTEKGYFIGADSNAAWSVMDKDLTTCLLLAVERCHEYKAAEAARGEK